ncbi:hypothetical protein ACFL0U_01430 [Pseudomonadota bacterium]
MEQEAGSKDSSTLKGRRVSFGHLFKPKSQTHTSPTPFPLVSDKFGETEPERKIGIAPLLEGKEERSDGGISESGNTPGGGFSFLAISECCEYIFCWCRCCLRTTTPEPSDEIRR